MIIDCAHYRDGCRQGVGPVAVEEAAARHVDGGFVWLGMFEPTPEELARVRDCFGLHELAVEDAQTFHMRPKVESYDGEVQLVILRTARYDDPAEEVEFGEISVFLSPKFVITVRQGVASELRGARARLEQRPDLLDIGTPAVLWAILDSVVDNYAPVIAGWNATSTRSRPRYSAAPSPRPSGSTRCAARPPTSTVPCTRCSAWSARSNARPTRTSRPTCGTCTTTSCW